MAKSLFLLATCALGWFGCRSTGKSVAHVHPYHVILRAPFFIYDDDIFRWDKYAWVETDNETLSVPQWMSQGYWPVGDTNPKHTDDWWFLQAALRHPMRTYDASEAKLFVVPTLVNLLMSSRIGHWRLGPRKFCMKTKNATLCGEELLNATDKKLSTSPWFKRNRGKDHIVVVSHIRPQGSKFLNKEKREWLYEAFPRCNILGKYDIGEFRFNRKDRLFIPKNYASAPCAVANEKTIDFAMIASFKDKPEFETRRAICTIMNKTDYVMPVCGEGAQCPTLAKSKFGFHVRGDKPSSQRLNDNILSGTVPIFTLKAQFEHRPFWIDWDELSYFADIEKSDTFLETIDAIYRDTEGYERRHANILSNSDLFNWTTIVPFDTMMQVALAHVHPEFSWPANASLPYSALLPEHL